MTEADLEEIRKKLNELEDRQKAMSRMMFSYFQGFINILSDKGISKDGEIMKYLDEGKKFISDASKDADFYVQMRKLFPDWESDEDE